MLELQRKGCHNINLVTATHFLPWVIKALRIACEKGLEIPIVYNCGGYELAEVISLINGIVDIYLPDMKYGTPGPPEIYSGAADYIEVNRAAVKEMFRQAGRLKIDKEGIAYRGVCIRHLVLPNDESGTLALLDYLKKSFDPSDIFISLMAQYRPLFRAHEYTAIDRTVEPDFYEKAAKAFIDAGFEGYYQEIERMDRAFIIDFTKRKEEPLTG
jgi:putative pyruvate formate lyase activating enzyme